MLTRHAHQNLCAHILTRDVDTAKIHSQVVKLASSAPAVSAAGIDVSAEALKDRSERFVCTGENTRARTHRAT